MKIAISAAETSGDLLGGELLVALKKLNSDITIEGLGVGVLTSSVPTRRSPLQGPPFHLANEFHLTEDIKLLIPRCPLFGGSTVIIIIANSIVCLTRKYGERGKWLICHYNEEMSSSSS